MVKTAVLAAIGALVGDPGRANRLLALQGTRAVQVTPAGELGYREVFGLRLS